MHFLSYKSEKGWQFCVLVNARAHDNIFRILNSYITFIDPIFDHPVYRFSPKPEIFDFTASGFELPWGHQLWKYMSLCLTNLYFMANALRNRDHRSYCLTWLKSAASSGNIVANPPTPTKSNDQIIFILRKLWIWHSPSPTHLG